MFYCTSTTLPEGDFCFINCDISIYQPLLILNYLKLVHINSLKNMFISFRTFHIDTRLNVLIKLDLIPILSLGDP